MTNDTQEIPTEAPWELENAEDPDWYVPGNLNKLTAVVLALGTFFAAGLVLL